MSWTFWKLLKDSNLNVVFSVPNSIGSIGRIGDVNVDAACALRGGIAWWPREKNWDAQMVDKT